MGELAQLELPASGAVAAQACLAARRPTGDPAQLRASARRATAIAAELRDAGKQMTSAADAASWSGAASDAFRTRLRSAAPNISATAQRYDSYALALLGYAYAVENLNPILQSLAAQLAEEASRTSVVPGLDAGGSTAAPLTVIDPAQALAAARQAEAHDQALLSLARRFAEIYDEWVQAVKACVAGIRHANAADPTRDLHGWLAWEHRLSAVAHYADPMLKFVREPSWKSASNALSWLGSNFTFIAMAVILVCPPAAAVCLTIAVALSAAQLAVDSWRKWGQHEQVSIATLVIDGLGAAPAGRLVEGARVTGAAAREGWGSATGVSRVSAAGAAGAPSIRHAAGGLAADLVHDPRQLVLPGYRQLPTDFFRSRDYGGAAALAARWTPPLLWDGSNAVLGLPQVAGGSSTPQWLWAERGTVKRAVSTVAEPIDKAAGAFTAGVRRAVDPPR